MRKLYAISVALIASVTVLFTEAKGQTVFEHYQYVSPKKLVEYCDVILSVKDGMIDTRHNQYAGLCLGYIMGLLDTWDRVIQGDDLTYSRICPYHYDAAMSDAAKAILRKYEPAIHERMATADFVRKILSEMYPCKK